MIQSVFDKCILSIGRILQVIFVIFNCNTVFFLCMWNTIHCTGIVINPYINVDNKRQTVFYKFKSTSTVFPVESIQSHLHGIYRLGTSLRNALSYSKMALMMDWSKLELLCAVTGEERWRWMPLWRCWWLELNCESPASHKLVVVSFM